MDCETSYETSGYYVNQTLGPQYCLMPLVEREGTGHGVHGCRSTESGPASVLG